MMLVYSYDSTDIRIEETKNGDDIEFHLQVHEAQEMITRLKKVRDFFEGDDIYTDVLFYAYPNHRYSVIVRPEFYADFVLQLMKQQILTRVEWRDN